MDTKWGDLEPFNPYRPDEWDEAFRQQSFKERQITVAGQNPPPAGFIKAGFTTRTRKAGIIAYLVAPEIFPCGLVAIQSVKVKRLTPRADKTVFFRLICKTMLIRTVGEINSRDIPGYPENLQATLGRAGVVTSAQCNTSVSYPDVSHLLLQMPRNDKAFLLVGGEGVHSGNDAMLAVHRHLGQIAHAPLGSMIDISALWICCTGGSLVHHCFFWWFLVSGLLGKFSVQIIQIAVHTKLDVFPDIDPTGTGNVGRTISVNMRSNILLLRHRSFRFFVKVE